MKRTSIALLALATPLAACGDDPAPIADSTEDAGAQGEILGGTISDAMLPVDGLQSQSPSMASDDDDSDDGGAPASSAPASESAPAATPEPEPEPEASDDEG